MKWETIESAPKDGTQIIVSRGREYAHVTWWRAREGHGEWSLVNTGDYATSSNIQFEPTHWALLEPAQ